VFDIRNFEKTMFVEVGPVSVVITGEREGIPFEFSRDDLEQKIRSILEEIRDCLPILRQKAYKIKKMDHLPAVGRDMVEAVKRVDEGSLTPMAAVAGAVADRLVADLKEQGLDYVSVNNGGDIAIWNERRRTLRIGLGDIRLGRGLPYTLRIGAFKEFGVATSGFGGRSFTLGIAEMGTVIAEKSAVADAAATFICNRTNVKAPGIIRQRAVNLDPRTDIPDDLVTVQVGELKDEQVQAALEEGLQAAFRLKREGVIYGAVIILKGIIVSTLHDSDTIHLEGDHGH
jgi:hypothetical protein